MAASASRWVRELGGRSYGRYRNLELLAANSHRNGNSSIHSRQCGSAKRGGPASFDGTFSPQGAAPALGATPSSRQERWFLGGNSRLFDGVQGMGKIPREGWDSALSRSGAAFSGVAPPPPKKASTSVGESSKLAPRKPEEKKTTEEKTLSSRISDLFSALEKVPLAPLGLGLAGAIPFVGLTPGIASLLPLPDALSAIHIDAQATYGAVILTFLGGPHWGLAMAGTDWSQNSNLSKRTLNNVRYIWSVVPSLVAWPALLLSPLPKLAVLTTSFVLVLGVDVLSARNGLLPSWYMPLRYLLTGIATLSLASSLLVTAAGSV